MARECCYFSSASPNRFVRSSLIAAAAIALLAAAHGVASAQAVYGSISGIVTDPRARVCLARRSRSRASSARPPTRS